MQQAEQRQQSQAEEHVRLPRAAATAPLDLVKVEVLHQSAS
jgi:hypothetical protein